MHTYTAKKKKSNLSYQDVSCSIFNEDVSFQPIIKGRVSSRRAGATDPWILQQKPGEKKVLLPSTGKTLLIITYAH